MNDRKSVFEINIDDSQFSAFKEKFDHYQTELNKQPELWSGISEATSAATGQIDGAAEKVEEAEEASEEVEKKTKRGRRHALAIGEMWRVAFKQGRKFTTNVLDAGNSLRRWPLLTAAFTGIIGAGGLWGLNRLAYAGAERRQAAAGLGTTVGGLTSSQVNFGRLGNVEGILSLFSGALHSLNNEGRAALMGLGVPGNEHDPARAFASALPKLKRMLDAMPEEALGQLTRARGLDKLGIDVYTAKVIRAMSAAEIDEISRAQSGDISRFDIPPEVLTKWQDFNTQLERSGAEIVTALQRGLVNITPGLVRMSEVFVSLFDTLINSKLTGEVLKSVNDGVTWLADKLGSNTALEMFDTVLKAFELTKRDFDRINSWFESNITKLKWALGGAAVGAVVGAGVGGPLGAYAGAVVGGAIGSVLPEVGRNNGLNHAPRGARGAPPSGLGVSPRRPAPDGPAAQRPNALSPADPISLGTYGRGTPPPLRAAEGRRPDLDNVDPRLRTILAGAASHLPPGYSVRVNDGYNPNRASQGSQHMIKGQGAVDVVIIDPQGRPVNNRGDDPTGVYTAYARMAKTEMLSRYPELEGKLAWGGAFGVTATDPTQDLMHFDIGGDRGRYAPNQIANLPVMPERKPPRTNSPRRKLFGHPAAGASAPKSVTIQNDTDSVVTVQ